MIECIIVDDEAHAVEILKEYASKVPFLTIKATFSNPIDAIGFLQLNTVDLIFLDINMPRLTGIDFLKINNRKIDVILTTAYSEYAITGYENDVLDYLLKPFSFERFMQAVQKALNKGVKIPQQLMPPADQVEDHMFVKTDKGKIQKVNYKDILYIEGLKNYVSIYLTDGQRVVALLNIKDLQEQLPHSGFSRVHKSYIISLSKIKALDGGQIMIDGSKSLIPLGSTYRVSFLNMLKKRLVN